VKKPDIFYSKKRKYDNIIIEFYFLLGRMFMHIKIINGPNLNLLGMRDKGLYGFVSLNGINEGIRQKAEEIGATISFYQSNSEGEIINQIHDCIGKFDGIIINPGGYTHYSIAIRDAIESVNIPVVEVHMSNIFSREEFRKKTVTGEKTLGVIAGFGAAGYWLAIIAIRDILGNKGEN
jgi:3-dehydroquinate dehydratase-2